LTRSPRLERESAGEYRLPVGMRGGTVLLTILSAFALGVPTALADNTPPGCVLAPPPLVRPMAFPPPAAIETDAGVKPLLVDWFDWSVAISWTWCEGSIARELSGPFFSQRFERTGGRDKAIPRSPSPFLERGALVRFHLGFQPTAVSLALRPNDAAYPTRVFTLVPDRTPTWLVQGSARFIYLTATGEDGTVRYASRVELASRRGRALPDD
jgi:hypothetical protein